MPPRTRKPLGRYRKVTVTVWRDPKVRALSPPAKLAWAYLLTTPLSTSIPGVFAASPEVLAGDFDWPIYDRETAENLGWQVSFQDALREVEQAGMVLWDPAGVMWLPRALVHNAPENPNCVRSWRLHWAELPDCRLKARIWEALRAYCEDTGPGYSTAFLESCPPVDEASANGSPNHAAMVPVTMVPCLPESGAGAGAGAGDLDLPSGDLVGQVPDVPPVRSGAKAGKANAAEVAEATSRALTYLNEKAGRDFHLTDTAKRLVRGLLARGYTVRDLKLVIWHRCTKWLTDPRMVDYLRPKTLFALSNFETYIADARQANGERSQGGNA